VADALLDVLGALVDVDTDTIRELESEADVDDPDAEDPAESEVVEPSDPDTVALTSPEVDDPGELPEPGVAVCQ
jgi:hypothetical protein